MLSGCCNAYGKVMQVFHTVLCTCTLSKYYVQIYIQVLLSLLIFEKWIVFVSVCLRDGLFTWTINSLNFLLYVVGKHMFHHMFDSTMKSLWLSLMLLFLIGRDFCCSRGQTLHQFSWWTLLLFHFLEIYCEQAHHAGRQWHQPQSCSVFAQLSWHTPCASAIWCASFSACLQRKSQAFLEQHSNPQGSTIGSVSAPHHSIIKWFWNHQRDFSPVWSSDKHQISHVHETQVLQGVETKSSFHPHQGCIQGE